MAYKITKKEMQKILDREGLVYDTSSLPEDAVITNYDLSKEPISIIYSSKRG